MLKLSSSQAFSDRLKSQHLDQAGLRQPKEGRAFYQQPSFAQRETCDRDSTRPGQTVAQWQLPVAIIC